MLVMSVPTCSLQECVATLLLAHSDVPSLPGRLLEASALLDDVFASALAGRVEPTAAVLLAKAAAASPAAKTGAHLVPSRGFGPCLASASSVGRQLPVCIPSSAAPQLRTVTCPGLLEPASLL